MLLSEFEDLGERRALRPAEVGDRSLCDHDGTRSPAIEDVSVEQSFGVRVEKDPSSDEGASECGSRLVADYNLELVDASCVRHGSGICSSCCGARPPTLGANGDECRVVGSAVNVYRTPTRNVVQIEPTDGGSMLAAATWARIEPPGHGPVNG